MKVNSIADEVAGVLTLSLVDRGFNTQSCQSKDYEIGYLIFLCCSAEYAALRVKANTGWFGFRLMCSRLVDVCFMEYYNSNLMWWCSTKHIIK